MKSFLQTLIFSVGILVLCACEESPERKLARVTLEKMEKSEALQRIEQASLNIAETKDRMKSGTPGDGDKLDLERWMQESKEASDAAEKMGISLDEQLEAMKAGYAKFYEKQMKQSNK